MIGFITGLPRSRTHWFAEYFGHYCPTYHEPTNGLSSRHELYELIESGCVVSDSGLFITDVFERYPLVPVVIIERPIEDVFESLCAFFKAQGYPEPSIDFLRAQEAAISRLNGLRVPFDEIDERLEEITEYLGFEYDEEWGEAFKEVNSQIEHLTADPESYLLWGAFEELVA